MWSRCYKCNGEENINGLDCNICYREYDNLIVWYYFRGLIWIDDNEEPLSPPSSPR